jgi:hypothetical protein
LLSDAVTVNLTVGVSSSGAGVLGSSTMSYFSSSYLDVYSKLQADATSLNDKKALSSLSSSGSLGLLINHTSDDPYGSGSVSWYLDSNGSANNSTIMLSTANAKAMDLFHYSGMDGTITFNSYYSFDYDRSDGISAGSYDFIGLAAHEIGHQLGFVSGVDYLDSTTFQKQSYTADHFTYVEPLDLFRYSQSSKALGVIDWTADTREKYLSLDNGATAIASFSTGKYYGDGRQTSHWKDYLDIGIMDPTAAPAEWLTVSSNDVLAMDIIGWDVVKTSNAVPEPSAWQLVAVGFSCAVMVRRYRAPDKSAH